MKRFAYAFVLATLAISCASAIDCSPEQAKNVTAANEKMHAVCATVFALAGNMTSYNTLSNGEKMCDDTTCLDELDRFTAGLPDCTVANYTSKAEYLRQFASIKKSCSVIRPTPSPPPATVDCTPHRISGIAEDEKKLKNTCGAVFSMATTVQSDPQGAGKKICENNKCWNAFESFFIWEDCLVDGLSFMNAYMRQFATTQLSQGISLYSLVSYTAWSPGINDAPATARVGAKSEVPTTKPFGPNAAA